ncbi:hypothetical protein FV242_32840, partial [Methylobacterium sp. WL64]
CTDPVRDPTQIVTWFVRRWQVEVTFQEARAHLGVETQRQWSDRALGRHAHIPDDPGERKHRQRGSLPGGQRPSEDPGP